MELKITGGKNMNLLKIKKSITPAILISIALLFMGGCATFYHAHMMKGNILKQQGNEYYLCIGTKDGAKEGQIYNVFTYKENPMYVDTDNYLQRVYIGTIKITNIVHEHYAKAVLVSGRANKYDFVELK
jgi:hypothetical protein